jgi:hypothetical protein
VLTVLEVTHEGSNWLRNELQGAVAITKDNLCGPIEAVGRRFLPGRQAHSSCESRFQKSTPNRARGEEH